MPRIRVLVADDSALMRQTLKRVVEQSPDLELVGLARDGADAVAKARELRPDVISMDINMPMDGISALQIILEEKICPVVMVSSLTQKGTTTNSECLELGAFDFVAKPDGTVSSNMGAVAEELISKLKAAEARGIVDSSQRGRERRQAAPPFSGPMSHPTSQKITQKITRKIAIAMGISTGGPATLQEVLPLIPADVPASFFLVQHMPPTFIASFAKRLNEACALEVVVARSGMTVEPSICYVAPGGMYINMSNMDGYEFIGRIRADTKYDSLPIIIVSTESESRNKAKGFAAGANLYIEKPCAPEMMVENVRMVMDAG